MPASETASPHELTCRELVELVTDYFEGALSPEERLRFEGHISVCPPCRKHLKQMRETIRLLGTLTEEDLSQKARGELLHAFHGWRSGRA